MPLLAAGCTTRVAAPVTGLAKHSQAQPRVGCHHCWKAVATVRRGRGCGLGRRGVVTCAVGGSDNPPPGDSTSSAVPDVLPMAGVDTDWRQFRAQLVASAAASSSGTAGARESASAAGAGAASSDAAWAHGLPLPEKGCLLLANPLMFATSQTYFHMSVILIFNHDEGGTAGLILNRPTEFTVGQLGQGASHLQPELNDCQLLLGGDVGAETVHLLHGIQGLPGSAEVFSGVQMGGFEGAKQGLAEGRFTPDQFKVLTRYAGWGAGQLAAECNRGVWMPVSASKHAILQQHAAKGVAPADMWHYVAQLAGGDLAALSSEVRGVTDPDIQRATGGGYLPQEEGEEQESEPGDSSSSDPSQQQGPRRRQQQQRRGRLPEADYRDGAGI